jgi:hypothetical protein
MSAETCERCFVVGLNPCYGRQFLILYHILQNFLETVNRLLSVLYEVGKNTSCLGLLQARLKGWSDFHKIWRGSN